ncbi:MAG: peptide ABC transporter substrate-binding protein [Marinovum sp.]|nr:peptide ABC transporter substrate-binding protein [Marinovum sp.]
MKFKNYLSNLSYKLTDGQIDRRQFVMSALAAGVALPSALGMADMAAAATPKKGGRLRIGVTGGATTDTLDPGQILDMYMINVQFGQTRNNLTVVGSDGLLQPELAEEWGASADASVWTFKIRSGVEFHNGKTLSVEDVVDSLNHHLGEDSKSAAKGILSGIDSVKADGKNHVAVALKGGNADFPFMLSDYHVNMCPSNGDGTIDWQSGVGTGGYMIAEHDPGVRTLTKRNPNYWKDGAAHFDECETIQIGDTSARTSALMTGAVDAIANADLKTINLLKRNPEMAVRSTTGNKQITLPMITTMAPFDNADVRNAVKHVIDREDWLEKVILGYGELGNDNPVGPANIYRATTDELPQRAYDPEKAKYHLKQAGLDKLAIQFHAADTGFSGAVDAGSLMAESARAAGIDVEVVREPNDGYWSNVWMKKAFSACYWSGRPTEDILFSQIYAEGASWNDTYWSNDRFNELLLQARAELDTTKRRDMYVEMQQLLHNDGGLCLPLFQSDVMAHNTSLHVPDQIANNLVLDGCLNCDRWWFA